MVKMIRNTAFVRSTPIRHESLERKLTERPNNKPFQDLVLGCKSQEKESQRDLDQTNPQNYDNSMVEHILAEDLEIVLFDVQGNTADPMIGFAHEASQDATGA
jgi:hypothetical protein